MHVGDGYRRTQIIAAYINYNADLYWRWPEVGIVRQVAPNGPADNSWQAQWHPEIIIKRSFTAERPTDTQTDIQCISVCLCISVSLSVHRIQTQTNSGTIKELFSWPYYRGSLYIIIIIYLYSRGAHCKSIRCRRFRPTLGRSDFMLAVER